MSNDTGFVITSRWPVISSVPLKAPKTCPSCGAKACMPPLPNWTAIQDLAHDQLVAEFWRAHQER